MTFTLADFVSPTISWSSCLGFPGFCTYADAQLGRAKTYFTEILILGSFASYKPRLVDLSPTTIPLYELYNNQATSINGTYGDFDGRGVTFPAEYFPTGNWTHDDIKYELPEEWGYGLDNVIGTGQNITLSRPVKVHELHMLYSSDGDWDNGQDVKLKLNFKDDTSQLVEFTSRSFWRVNAVQVGAIPAPFHYREYGKEYNGNVSQIYEYSTFVTSQSELVNITLPDNGSPRFHTFALSLTESHIPSFWDNLFKKPIVALRRVRFTQNWEWIDDVRAQVVEVTIANLLPESQFSEKTSILSQYTVEVTGPALATLKAGVFNRLVTSDQVTVRVLVANADWSGEATVILKDSKGNEVGSSSAWSAVPLKKTWTAEKEDLMQHETPTWFDDAKYGIFIHWGLYSVPAWAPVGTYAEWYDWTIRNPADAGNPTWKYHKDTYGPDFRYDDFIANFSAPKFNASEWVDVIDKAGANYFVMTTKHHDGYALFDTEDTTHRSSVHLGPKRDFIAELLDTAKAEKPHIHRGTYFSMPEWFNPTYGKYGFQRWPGDLARDPYNQSELEPYTGHLEISDYLEDLQLPQMLLLAEKYDTEIMWCDIGGPNISHIFAERFYNRAWSQGRQVTMNDRCGVAPDFDTPEYARVASVQRRKWESCEGVDPGSFGLNKNTPDYLLRSPTQIVQTLVDIVSKNGNYLLDIGPDGDGSITTAMQNNLLDAGKWLKHSGRCIYSSRFWYKRPQDMAGSVRYTKGDDFFCIVSFVKPSDGHFVLRDGLPLVPNDEIYLLGAPRRRGGLKWTFDNGELDIQVSDADVKRVEHAWAFQIVYSKSG